MIESPIKLRVTDADGREHYIDVHGYGVDTGKGGGFIIRNRLGQALLSTPFSMRDITALTLNQVSGRYHFKTYLKPLDSLTPVSASYSDLMEVFESIGVLASYERLAERFGI